MVKLGSRQDYYDQLPSKDHVYTEEDCPFCNYEDKNGEVLWRGEYWLIVHNIFPYSGDEKHLMAVPFAHKAFSHQLTKEEMSELTDVHAFMKSYYGDGHYFSCTRETMANRSIEHMHMHFLPGALKGKYLRHMLMHQGFPIEQELDNI